MNCGPDAALERHDGAVLHCPRCGTRQQVPAFPLFVVTGASGTGKTTITGPLRRVLPGCDVFDTDVILQVAALGWDVWRNTWLRLEQADLRGGGDFLGPRESCPVQRVLAPARLPVAGASGWSATGPGGPGMRPGRPAPGRSFTERSCPQHLCPDSP